MQCALTVVFDSNLINFISMIPAEWMPSGTIVVLNLINDGKEIESLWICKKKEKNIWISFNPTRLKCAIYLSEKWEIFFWYRIDSHIKSKILSFLLIRCAWMNAKIVITRYRIMDKSGCLTWFRINFIKIYVSSEEVFSSSYN